MKPHYPILLGLVISGMSLASSVSDSIIDRTKDAFVLYKSDDAFVRKMRLTWLEQYQISMVQPNGSNGMHLKSGASPMNQEFRRSWVGLTADLASNTTFRACLRLGGLPERETYAGGFTKRNFSYTGLFELYVKQNIPGTEGLSVQVGKFKSLFTLDYAMPSSALYCIERSVVSNQFAQDSNWGIDLTYAPDKENQVYLQLMANDRASSSKSMTNSDVYRDGRGIKGEFGWEDRCFVILGASHRFNVMESGYQEIGAQYLHDFNNTYNDRRAPGANYFGLSFRDAASLTYKYKHDRFLLLSNLVAAFEQQTGKGSDNIGIEIEPVYSVTPHIDLVLRYVGMTGDGACKLGADRYICTQTTAPLWVDSLHTFYAGADFYFSEKQKNAAMFMLGAEYTTARVHGSNCYNGWAISSAVRLSF